MKKNNIILTAVVLVLIVGLGYLIFGNSDGPRIGPVGSVHSHASFMVFIDGEQINFALPKYMVRVQEVHVEDMDGVAIHNHATGVTLGYFLKTLGFDFTEDCFILENKKEFCIQDGLKFYIDGVENFEYGNHAIMNGERYLISSGSSEDEIQKQLGILNQ